MRPVPTTRRPLRLHPLLPVLLVSAVFLTPLPAQGQEEPPLRAFAGGDILLAYPVGEFAENVSFGIGIGGYGRVALDEQGLFSLRGELGFINYGNETIKICVTQPCRVTGDLTTSNNIFLGGIGPELGFGSGSVRLYGTATVGFAYFATSSSVSGSNNQGQPFADSTNFDDLTFAWTAGPGIQFRVARGRVPVSLDIAARYHGNGEARYLRKGDIQDEPDGTVVINPRQSETNLWSFRIGASAGIPSRDPSRGAFPR
jgi:hypothetical protein